MSKKLLVILTGCVLGLWMFLGMLGCSGSSRYMPDAASETQYPLVVSTDGRYLVDQNDKPFFIHGDSPQSLMVNLSEPEAELYFSKRQSAGFNAVWVNLLCASGTAGRDDGSTFDGIKPFTTPGDLSTPNPDYFNRADSMIRRAADHGLLVFLNPIETKDWLPVLRANGESAAREYGQYLGTRYRAYDNIIWLNGNDFQSWQDPADDALVQAVALGIKECDERHLHTIELNYYSSGSLDDALWAPIIRLNASYTYFPTYAQVLGDYNRSQLPTFLVEAAYEFEDQGTPGNIRRQAYWALLSGAAGHLYGSKHVWRFLPGWKDYLDTTGSKQMRYLKSIFSSRAWHRLIPDQNHELVISGYGTFDANGRVSDSDYVTTASTSDGTLAIAYLPDLNVIEVDFSRFSGPVQARWYDPANGQFHDVERLFDNRDSARLAPPGLNAEGARDWVLLMELK